MALLFLLLFLTYFYAFAIVDTYGNPYLTIAITAYGAFLACLFAGIPYILNQKKWVYFFIILEESRRSPGGGRR